SEHLLEKPKPNAKLTEVAEQFEAIFLNQMLKQMREAKLSDGIFDNSANEKYYSLLDMEQSKHLASNVNLGIADALMRQLGTKLIVE
ncbi:MAG: rod-binding protein, partial [Candidatus Puniceispirillaceae bacterium]